MSRPSGDIVVVGAGLIGLAIAFELAARGAGVRLYDRGEPARSASWAGAGMLAPFTERITDEHLLALCASSLREYPAFVRRVEGASGIDVRLRLDGVLYAAFERDGLAALQQHAEELRTRGIDCEILSRTRTIATEPWLGPHSIGSLLKTNEGHVDNRRLGRALAAACIARGVLIEKTSSIAVECDARRLLGVRTDRGFVPAACVVNACGAWSASLGGVPDRCVPPVEPIKGQMLALAAPTGFVRRATWVPGAYLVPRDDGRLLVGATIETAGFDERATAYGIHALLHAALTAAPALGAFAMTESWAGLRPATPDGLPFIGPTSLQGYWLATGHYRNGILLAPVTARLIADAIQGADISALEPFMIARLGTEGALRARIS